jgi:hypothetical protein
VTAQSLFFGLLTVGCVPVAYARAPGGSSSGNYKIVYEPVPSGTTQPQLPHGVRLEASTQAVSAILASIGEACSFNAHKTVVVIADSSAALGSCDTFNGRPAQPNFLVVGGRDCVAVRDLGDGQYTTLLLYKHAAVPVNEANTLAAVYGTEGWDGVSAPTRVWTLTNRAPSRTMEGYSLFSTGTTNPKNISCIPGR